MFRDGDAMRLLDNIPSDLKVRGWRYSYTESSAQKDPAVPWYDAVYIRHFESDIDDAALEDRSTGMMREPAFCLGRSVWFVA
jgi:hypothetical protein